MLVRSEVEPALGRLGFAPSGAAWRARLGEVGQVVEVEVAPWSRPERIAFTLAWGVHVPGLAEVLDDEPAGPRRVGTCPVRGRLGEADGAEPTWHVIATLPRPIATLRAATDAADSRIALLLVRAVEVELTPRLRALDSVEAVHAELAAELVVAARVPSEGELAAIRAVAALSLLRGERDNAGRWLDYLQARSSATMAPDLVAERLAGLRARCAG